MAINFPDSPSVNDTVTQGDHTWIWDGTTWNLTVATAVAPAGSNTQVQYNSSGSFAGSANLTFNGTTLTANAFSGPLTGDVTGNVSGTAATVTGAAQSNITSVGTLTGLSVTGTVTVGVDDTGHDVQFFGAAAGSHLLWDESENRLDVVASSGAAYIRSLNGTATTYIGSDSSNTALFGTSTAHDTRLIVEDAERFRITTGADAQLRGVETNKGGYLRFMDSAGTALCYVGSPGNDDVHLKGDIASGYIYIGNGGTYKFYSSSSSVSGWLPYTDNTFDLGAGGLRWDDVYATNGTIQTSDVNMKKDITNATLGLDFINALRPVEYKWNDGSRKHQGFIAQEVKTVLDAQDAAADQAMWGLNTIKEGTKVIRPITDENGMPQKTEVDNEERQSLRYTELIAPLVKAVQELTTRIETLEGS